LSGVIGFTGGSAYAGKFTPSYAVSASGTHYGNGKIEERHLVMMAKNLSQTVRQVA